MKKLIIVVLVLVVVGVAFYFGYHQAIAPKSVSLSPNNKINFKSTAIAYNPNTQEISWITKLDTPMVVFEQDGLNRKLTATVNLIPNNYVSQSTKEYKVILQLITVPINSQVNADIRVQENQSFAIMMGSNNSQYRFEGMVNPVENDQVKVRLKIR
ncbi:MAG: hypothetical protein ACE14V_11800 [bacterium]